MTPPATDSGSTDDGGRRYLGRPATELAALVRSGEARAIDVLEEHLDQIARVDRQVGAFQLVRAEAARREAAAVDAMSKKDRAALPLAGVPIAIKDNIDIEGEPTRNGSEASSDAPATADDPLIANIRAAGAVMVGKTRVPELCLWGATDGPLGTAHNPWNLERTPGGSSGGSGAAVASGQVPLALGSDGLGSIRIPSANCGLFGIKPGGGVLPRSGDHPADDWFGMAHFGPIATTVDDAALLLDVLAGAVRLRDPEPPSAILRVAVSVQVPAAGITLARDQWEATAEVGRILRHLGHTVYKADPPYRTKDAIALTLRWTAGAERDVEVFGLDPEGLQPRSRAHIEYGRGLRERVALTDAQADEFKRRMHGFFDEHDLLVVPALARTAIKAEGWAEKSWLANVNANIRYAPFASPWNLADLPAAVVPGEFASDGMPLSTQLVAGPGREELVLAVAKQLEAVRPWKRNAPLAGTGV